MTKEVIYYCDLCGDLIKGYREHYFIHMKSEMGSNMIYRFEYKDLCVNCAEKFHEVLKEVEKKIQSEKEREDEQ